jgi:hypothetical protein
MQGWGRDAIATGENLQRWRRQAVEVFQKRVVGIKPPPGHVPAIALACRETVVNPILALHADPFRGSPASPPGAPHGARYREVVAVGAVVLGVCVVGAGCPTVGVVPPVSTGCTGTQT